MIFSHSKQTFANDWTKGQRSWEIKIVLGFYSVIGFIYSFRFKKPWDQHLSNTLLWSKLKEVWNSGFWLRCRTKTIEGRCFSISNSSMAQLVFLRQITAHLLAKILDICCYAACWDFPKQRFYAVLYHWPQFPLVMNEIDAIISSYRSYVFVTSVIFS